MGGASYALFNGYTKMLPIFTKKIPYLTINRPDELEYLFYVRWADPDHVTAHIEGYTLHVKGYDRAMGSQFPSYTVSLPPGRYRKEDVKVLFNPDTGIAYVNIRGFKAPTINVKGSMIPGYSLKTPEADLLSSLLTCSVNADETPTEAAAPKPPVLASSVKKLN